jgi:deoxyribodipyrimidine photo-lyase
LKNLNDKPVKSGNYVLYWMQASQRVVFNPALEYAIEQANKRSKPILVFFGITDNYPDANLRHYYFMLQGLIDVFKRLEKRGIAFVLRIVSPEMGAVELSKDASMIIVDRGYVKIQRKWRDVLAKKAKCKVIQVEGDVVVPIEVVSDKEEFSARTIRSKIKSKLETYLKGIESINPKVHRLNMKIESIDPGDVKGILSQLKIDVSVDKVDGFTGGYSEAKKCLDLFIGKNIHNFAEYRNHPGLKVSSNLSPFLHFGHISPVDIALNVLKKEGPGVEAFLEELIVRRELSMNFVCYNQNYDNYNGLNDWAKNTLLKHATDKRDYVYTLEELENAETHDPYWNAAQMEMVKKGKMQGYMRMYWGKKIIEWTKDPKKAYEMALYLNNKYELDGRDPNSFTGVAWCFGKHDRPWKERPVFGKVRYMNDKGLERKFDMKLYLNKIGI